MSLAKKLQTVKLGFWQWLRWRWARLTHRPIETLTEQLQKAKWWWWGISFDIYRKWKPAELSYDAETNTIIMKNGHANGQDIIDFCRKNNLYTTLTSDSMGYHWGNLHVKDMECHLGIGQTLQIGEVKKNG